MRAFSLKHIFISLHGLRCKLVPFFCLAHQLVFYNLSMYMFYIQKHQLVGHSLKVVYWISNQYPIELRHSGHNVIELHYTECL